MTDWRASSGLEAKGVGPVAVTDCAPDRPLEALYRKYGLELCKYLARTFGAGPPEPEDVAHEAFTRYAALDAPERVRNPRAFLYRTARNIVLDSQRRAQTAFGHARDAQNSDGASPDGITPERVLLGKDALARVSAAFAALPKKQQVVLSLRRLDGATYEEIAARTGWSHGDIARQLAAGMSALAEAAEIDLDRVGKVRRGRVRS